MPNSSICSIPGCENPEDSRGWCASHYGRWRRHGDPLGAPSRKTEKIKCSVEGCDKPMQARTWCKHHYRHWWRKGDPVEGSRRRSDSKAMVLFIESAMSYDGDECLLWPFGTTPSGYGQITYKGRKGIASRFVCEGTYGDPPSPSYEAAHNCGQGHLGCISPCHLRWATRAENMADKAAHGTQPVGEMVGGSKLKDEDVIYIKSMEGIISQQALASTFNVSRRAIHDVFSGRTWKHVA